MDSVLLIGQICLSGQTRNTVIELDYGRKRKIIERGAGKRHSGRTRKGNPLLREAMVEAVRAVARTKNTYLSIMTG
jgi:hypothetical protein